MSVQDRRKHPRFEGEFQVDLLNLGDDPSYSPSEAVIPGLALDVSKEGMRLQVAYDVPVGSQLSVVTYYHGRESLCLCDVVWKRDKDGKNLYGLYIRKWTYMDAELERKLSVMEKEQEQKNTPPSAPAVVTKFAVA